MFMTIREVLEAELEKIDDAYLEELYEIIQRFVQTRQSGKKQTLMHKLRSIQIDGPSDFAANLDAYVLPETHG
jgi:hypothetical protein